LPPAPSGISDYSAELLGHLSESYDIELVVDPRDPQVAPELAANHTVLLGNEVAVRHEARPFDLFVYQLGNSHYHVYMLDLMRRFRSLAVLHDFCLGGLVLPAIEDGEWPTTLAEELEFEGEKKLARAWRAGAVTDLEVLDQCPLNRRILAAAGAVIVHSTWSWQRVRRLVSVPVARVPQAAPVPLLKPGAQMRTRLNLPRDTFIVATLGFVGPPKRIPSLFHAVAALPMAIRQHTLVLVVGYAAKEVQAQLRDLAEQIGIASMVRLVGRVPLEDFAAYARAADVCVQLRYPTRGETSAALLRELAAGAVCVISNYGSIAEIPDGVVLKVRTPDHEVVDLTAILQRLYEHPEKRTALREAAVNYVRQYHDVKQVVQHYQAMIELLASQRETRDTLWTELACEALEDRNDPVAWRLIEPWAALRARGQKLLSPMRAAPRSIGVATVAGLRTVI
jgi:glycosyltransferase involved in cell wall biosynthesis